MPAREHAVSSNAPAHVPCRHRRIQHIQQHACTSPHHGAGTGTRWRPTSCTGCASRPGRWTAPTASRTRRRRTRRCAQRGCLSTPKRSSRRKYLLERRTVRLRVVSCPAATRWCHVSCPAATRWGHVSCPAATRGRVSRRRRYQSVFARRPIVMFCLDENNRCTRQPGTGPRTRGCHQHWPRPAPAPSPRIRARSSQRHAPRSSTLGSAWLRTPGVRCRSAWQLCVVRVNSRRRFRFSSAFLSPLRLPNLPASQHGIAQAVARIPSIGTEMVGVYSPPLTPQVIHHCADRACACFAAFAPLRCAVRTAGACMCVCVFDRCAKCTMPWSTRTHQWLARCLAGVADHIGRTHDLSPMGHGFRARAPSLLVRRAGPGPAGRPSPRSVTARAWLIGCSIPGEGLSHLCCRAL